MAWKYIHVGSYQLQRTVKLSNTQATPKKQGHYLEADSASSIQETPPAPARILWNLNLLRNIRSLVSILSHINPFHAPVIPLRYISILSSHLRPGLPRRLSFSCLPTKKHVLSTTTFNMQGGPGSSVGIATELRAGRSGDRIPVGGEIFRTCPDRPWGPTSLLYNGYLVFPGGRERPRRDADPSPPSSAVVIKG